MSPQIPQEKNDTSIGRLSQESGLSAQVFNQIDPKSAPREALPHLKLAAAVPDSKEHETLDNPFSKISADVAPMLPPSLKETLAEADVLVFSAPIDNVADGKLPDFRFTHDRAGNERLVPGQRDNLLSHDGRLNIEINSGNKSLRESIASSDMNTKESVREIMKYWLSKHPGRNAPLWWQDILKSRSEPPAVLGSKVIVDRMPPLYPAPAHTPPPPLASAIGWQQDYRNGSGRGYGAESVSGYYMGNGDGYAPAYFLPNEVSRFNDPTDFVSRVTKAILRNDQALNMDGSPHYQDFIADDNGGISVGLRHWHAGGALPELLNAWHDKNAAKFDKYFNGYSSAQINAMRAATFAAAPQLVQGMKDALADPEFQSVQSKLMHDWVSRETKVGLAMGIKCEHDLANYIGLANLYGQDRANHAALDARPVNPNPKAMDGVLSKGEFADPYLCILVKFSDGDANLGERVPPPGPTGQRLAKQIEYWNERMHSVGHCAKAVQRALADIGMPQFRGVGDAWNMLAPLERSGLFVRVPQEAAAVGDLIVRPPSEDKRQHSYYGDISVVTARNGDHITQTNDSSYEFVADNPRYDGNAVFLRFVGEDKLAMPPPKSVPARTEHRQRRGLKQ